MKETFRTLTGREQATAPKVLAALDLVSVAGTRECLKMLEQGGNVGLRSDVSGDLPLSVGCRWVNSE